MSRRTRTLMLAIFLVTLMPYLFHGADSRPGAPRAGANGARGSGGSGGANRYAPSTRGARKSTTQTEIVLVSEHNDPPAESGDATTPPQGGGLMDGLPWQPRGEDDAHAEGEAESGDESDGGASGEASDAKGSGESAAGVVSRLPLDLHGERMTVRDSEDLVLASVQPRAVPQHVVDAFTVSDADLARHPPANVTASFKGMWEFENMKRQMLPALRYLTHPTGVWSLATRTTETPNPHLSVVLSDFYVRDGTYSDVFHRMPAHGVYNKTSGILQFVAGSPGHAVPIQSNLFTTHEQDLTSLLSVVYNPMANLPLQRVEGERRLAPNCVFKGVYRVMPVIGPDETMSDELFKTRSSGQILRMNGMVWSPNCDIVMSANATALGVEFTPKALHYTVLVSAVSLVQVWVLIRQMAYTNSQSGNSRVSTYMIGMHAITDACWCLLHLTMGILLEEALFNAFAITAFFKFAIFSLFEMRYLIVIYKAQRPQGDEFNMRREISSLYFGMYGMLFVGLFLLMRFMWLVHYAAFLSQSYWVPQIVRNVNKNTRRPVHPHYLAGMSLSRLALPLYFYGCPHNFLVMHSNWPMAALLIAWQGVQVAALVTQRMWGARWFFPARYLPERFDYHPVRTLASEEEAQDCVICQTEILGAPNERMVTPCNHEFHTACLQRWMEIKLECPTCRQPLPEY